MQTTSNDKSARVNGVQDMKDYKSQSLATQVKIGEYLISLMPAFKKTIDLFGEDIIILSTENESF